jgi:molybdopterin/thiamine biosynthesis adenylyltransferase
MRPILTEYQLDRFHRQVVLPSMGQAGQAKLLSSSVLVIGLGGLGSPAALYLAAAGVGTIGLVDCDSVDVSNLQRQIIHSEAAVGAHKVDSAAQAIHALNSGVLIRQFKQRISASTISDILRGFDFVVDATDNAGVKFLINDACVKIGTPFSHAGVLQYGGQVTTVVPGTSACVRCVFGNPPQRPAATCAEAGILGTVAGIIGTIQAAEAIKFLTAAGSILANELLTYDALSNEFRKIPIRRDASCPVCGIDPAEIQLHG